MTPTQQFVHTLQSLKPGDLGRLRKHAGMPLDETVDGFDLFAALWWPLRRESQRAPRREVAWLVAKLYGFRPSPYSPGTKLALQLGRLAAIRQRDAQQTQRKFDDLLLLPLARIEPALQWAVALVAETGEGLDWVRLTDDLSFWEREKTRLKWAEQYLQLAQ